MISAAGDVIDRVLLTPRAVEAWREACWRCALAARAAGVLGDEPPPDETAEVKEDGSLSIRGRMGKLTFEVRVPPEDWGWAPQAVE